MSTENVCFKFQGFRGVVITLYILYVELVSQINQYQIRIVFYTMVTTVTKNHETNDLCN